MNAKNDAGDTPLIHAITTDNISYDTKYDMVQLLLQQPGIEFDINTIILAESQEEDDQDQGGIPALIESYLLAKNKIEENRNKTIKEMANYKRHTVPKLSALAYYKLSTGDTQLYNNAVKDNTVPPLDGKLGGKRKTRKSKQKRRLK